MYWVEEAGLGPSYMDIKHENKFTKRHIKWLAYNTMHMATMLRKTSLPNKGNKLNE
ncbi:hypothetical protein [Staphylococcus pseudoxylosus]|uniref:hypothetical protein n=1 Tax=Staphylococcus pseudoxylosus TaxID=2282419 RepID=UPI002DBA8E3A|nr:hypothetical protein [Staphylococcus pseudoxylosus]